MTKAIARRPILNQQVIITTQAVKPMVLDQLSGPHAGDLPNLIVDASGKAHVEIIDQNVTLVTGSSSLLKTGGTALVIHDKADDDHSQPSGNAGDRLACGVIKR